MPPVKTAAKKSAKKPAELHDSAKSANDARRTFEHLGRIQAIATLTGAEDEALTLLSQRADEAFRSQHYKASADLLRAAEHLSFASLHRRAEETVADDLKNAIQREFDHLLKRTEEHAAQHSGPPPVRDLLTRMTRDAHDALEHGHYRSALEFARGAEALAHVNESKVAVAAGHEPERLER